MNKMLEVVSNLIPEGYSQRETVFVSPAWTFTWEDLRRVVRNGALFIWPIILAGLIDVGLNVLFEVRSAIPDAAIWGMVVKYLLDVLTDAVKKWRERVVYPKK